MHVLDELFGLECCSSMDLALDLVQLELAKEDRNLTLFRDFN